jgi:selenium metabolism protein YedF
LSYPKFSTSIEEAKGGKMIILVTNDRLGQANKELGQKMMGIFLNTLVHFPEALPKKILFYTQGVKLVCQGSPVITELELLEKLGVELISCITCLNYFGLEEKVVVGKIKGMPEIVDAILKADKVVTV